MLKEYQLKDFKAFADAAPLLIRPITLLYGPNSAGKSSIIQSLMLLKQTIEEAEDDSVVLLPQGKLVDLGNYREFVHLHDIDRQVSIKVQLDADSEDITPPEALDELSDTLSRIYKFLYSQLQEFPTLALELTFSVESIRSDIALQRVQLWLGQDEYPVITYEKTDQGLKVSELHPQHSFWQTWWQEYSLVLPNRVFNQLNITLEHYGISQINSRDRANTIEELEARKLSLSEQLASSQVVLESLKQQLDQLEHQIKDADQQLMALKSQQESVEKPLKEELGNLSRKLGDRLQLDPTPFFERNQIPENLTGEQMAEFTTGQLIWDQWVQLQVKHYEEQRPLTELKADYEAQIKETEQQDIATQNQAEQLSQAIVSIESLKSLWQHFSGCSLEQALKDYRQVVKVSTFILVSKFLPFESNIKLPDLATENSSEESSEISTHFFMGVYEGLGAVQLLIENTFYAGGLLQGFLRQSVYLGPMRDYPERFYLFSGKSTKQVGKSGKGSSDLLFEDASFLARVNQALETFKIGHEVKVVSFQDQDTTETSDIYAIRLVDSFFKTNVSLLDVGFGVSQVLPVIIQSLFARDQTIFIEQPEVHIHPRLQTELGDLFIDSVRDFGNRFIVETHSEHLMLRLQRRIREGKLKPDEVAVLYVDRTEEGSVCLQLRLNDKGKFIDKWPHGFFEEDIEEVFG